MQNKPVWSAEIPTAPPETVPNSENTTVLEEHCHVEQQYENIATPTDAQIHHPQQPYYCHDYGMSASQQPIIFQYPPPPYTMAPNYASPSCTYAQPGYVYNFTPPPNYFVTQYPGQNQLMPASQTVVPTMYGTGYGFLNCPSCQKLSITKTYNTCSLVILIILIILWFPWGLYCLLCLKKTRSQRCMNCNYTLRKATPGPVYWCFGFTVLLIIGITVGMIAVSIVTRNMLVTVVTTSSSTIKSVTSIMTTTKLTVSSTPPSSYTTTRLGAG